MSRISRLVALATSVTALAGALAATAGAVTWHVSGTGSFTATAPSPTLSVTASFTCASASATGTYATGSIVGAVYTIAGTITNTTCLLAGQNTELTCGYTLTAAAQPTATTYTTGTLDFTCGATLASNGAKLCHVEGSAHAIYLNRADGPDTLTVTTTSSVRTTGPTCLIGTNDLAVFSESTFTVTSSSGNGPDIVRTA